MKLSYIIPAVVVFGALLFWSGAYFERYYSGACVKSVSLYIGEEIAGLSNNQEKLLSFSKHLQSVEYSNKLTAASCKKLLNEVYFSSWD